MSQWAICVPVWRICTMWSLSCKGPIVCVHVFMMSLKLFMWLALFPSDHKTTTQNIPTWWLINNGNRTEWSPIWPVIIRVINKIGRPRSGSPICLITSMITDRIGRHEVLLPINHNHYNFRGNKTNAFLFHCLMLQICPFWKIPSLVG